MILIEKVHSTYFVPFRYKSKHRCITMHNVITPPPTFTYIATSATQTDTMSRLAPPPARHTQPLTYKLFATNY